jgi:hypothetical protein
MARERTWIGALAALLLIGQQPAAMARPIRPAPDPVPTTNPLLMTPANVAAVLAAARPGDTIRMEGVFTSPIFMSDRDFGGVRVDARGAVIAAGMGLRRVHNISFTGGVWHPIDAGEILRMEQSSHVSFAHASFRGVGDRTGIGMRISSSTHVTVRDNLFDNLRNAVIKGGVADSLVTRNRWVNGSEDGLKLLDSRRVIVSHNSCTGYALKPGYHADCIQLWSVPGSPVQSDIHILNNVAIGPQQGLASFDPADFSGTRFTFAGNLVATTTPHSITCLGCTDSLFMDNILIALPGGPFRSPLRAPGAGSGNVIINNPTFDWRAQTSVVLPEPMFTSFTPSIAGLVGSRWDDRSFGLTAAAASVPEPTGWALLGAGFGLIGAALRRRSALQAALHQNNVQPAAELFPDLPQQADTLKAAGGMEADRGLVA